MTARVIEGIFTVLDIKGSNKSLLVMAWPALQRIPLIKGSELAWSEPVDLSVLDSEVVKMGKDLVEPFFGVRSARIESRLERLPVARQWAVTAEIKDRCRVKILISNHDWMTEGTYHSDQGPVQWKVV